MHQNEGDKHNPVRMLIVEDHLMFRRSLRALLELFSERVEIVGEAASADDAVQMVRDHVPNIVLLDLELPQRSGVLTRPAPEHGVGAIARIRQVSPCTYVLVISNHEDPTVLFGALQAGAHGYITKADPYDGEKLVDAIERTVGGEAIYGALVAQIIRDYHQRRSRGVEAPYEELTPREREVLELLVDRKSNLEIAEKLVISVKTVKTHVANILAKLHLDSRYEVPGYVHLRRRERTMS
jgi:DNA-binding NarL/FixJ family response regulator